MVQRTEVVISEALCKREHGKDAERTIPFQEAFSSQQTETCPSV